MRLRLTFSAISSSIISSLAVCGKNIERKVFVKQNDICDLMSTAFEGMVIGFSFCLICRIHDLSKENHQILINKKREFYLPIDWACLEYKARLSFIFSLKKISSITRPTFKRISPFSNKSSGLSLTFSLWFTPELKSIFNAGLEFWLSLLNTISCSNPGLSGFSWSGVELFFVCRSALLFFRFGVLTRWGSRPTERHLSNLHFLKDIFLDSCQKRFFPS